MKELDIKITLGREVYGASFYSFLLSFFRPSEIEYNRTDREIYIKGAKFIAPETVEREMKTYLEEDSKRAQYVSSSDWININEIVLTEDEKKRIPNALTFEKVLH